MSSVKHSKTLVLVGSADAIRAFFGPAQDRFFEREVIVYETAADATHEQRMEMIEAARRQADEL